MNIASANTTLGSGTVGGVAVDLTNNRIFFSVGGTYADFGSGNDPTVPGQGLNLMISAGTTVFPVINFLCVSATGTAVLNVGASAFAHSPPSGFSPWG